MSDFNYMSIREYLVGDDPAFRSHIPILRENLPPELARMRGFRQHEAHGGLDPVDHTINVLYELDTSGLSRQDAEILRTAGLLHDIGKKDLPERDPEHAGRSMDVAMFVAEKMGFDSLDVWKVAVLARTHVHLGKYVSGFIGNYEIKRDLFASRRLFDMHLRLITADTKAMPAYKLNGCANGFLKKVNAAYEELKLQFHNR